MQEAVANTLTLDGLLAAVCDTRKLHPMGVRSKSVDESHVEARRVLCKLAYRRGISLSAIGRYLGRDHTTVRYNVKVNGGRLPDDAKRIEALWIGGSALPASDVTMVRGDSGIAVLTIKLSADSAAKFQKIADSRDTDVPSLVYELLNVAVMDDIVSAILD